MKPLIHLLFLSIAVCLSGHSRAEVPAVLTDILPIHSLVASVMEGLGEPRVLLNQDDEIHDHALRPSEVRELHRADLIFWVGPALSPWLEKPLKQIGKPGSVIELIAAPGSTVLARRTETPLESKQSYDPDNALASQIDAHAWLSPANATVWLQHIAEHLATFDPDNADRYRQNAQRQEGLLEGTVAAVRKQLSAAVDAGPHASYIVYHDAWQYFEEATSLQALASITRDEQSPSAAQLVAVQRLVVEENVDCVLVEPGYNKSLLMSVFERSSRKHVEVDPLGRSLTPGPDLYPELLATLADAFVECLGPSR